MLTRVLVWFAQGPGFNPSIRKRKKRRKEKQNNPLLCDNQNNFLIKLKSTLDLLLHTFNDFLLSFRQELASYIKALCGRVSTLSWTLHLLVSSCALSKALILSGILSSLPPWLLSVFFQNTIRVKFFACFAYPAKMRAPWENHLCLFSLVWNPACHKLDIQESL